MPGTHGSVSATPTVYAMTVKAIEWKEIGIVGRLLGWRWLERGPRTAVLKVPWWIPKSIRQGAMEDVAKDWQVRYGQPLLVTCGVQVIRFTVPGNSEDETNNVRPINGHPGGVAP